MGLLTFNCNYNYRVTSLTALHSSDFTKVLYTLKDMYQQAALTWRPSLDLEWIKPWFRGSRVIWNRPSTYMEIVISVNSNRLTHDSMVDPLINPKTTLRHKIITLLYKLLMLPSLT